MIRPSILTLSFAASLAAQGVTLATDSPYGVFARTSLAQDHKSIPALTILTSPVSIVATVVGADAATNLGPTASGVRIGEAGQTTLQTSTGRAQAGTTASVPPALIQQGPHSLLLRITNSRPSTLKGRLVLALDGNSSAGASAVLSIDVGNDNSIEYSQAVDGQPHNKELPVSIATSLVVKVVTDCSAERTAQQGRSSYALSANLEFVADPPPFVFAPYGQGCGDLQLSAQDTVVGKLHQLVVQQTGAFPASPGVLWFGAAPVNLTIPGSDCHLYTNPLIEIPFSSDATGKAVLFLPVASPVYGTAYMQGVSFMLLPPRFKTSNGLKVTCNG